MDLNTFIFPAPNSSYNAFTLDRLIWVPRTRFFSMKSITKSTDKFEDFYHKSKFNSKNSDENSRLRQMHIPCHYQSYHKENKDVILFFHGNAEDIGLAATFTRRLALDLKADVFSIEYPGYGIYEGYSNANTILEDAEIVFDFITVELGVNPSNIIVFGRSIGSGPATHLAANRTPGALILMSPYTSIKAVVKDIAGSFVSSLFAERFSNIEEIERVECPSYFIHGKKDEIIPWEHSQNLYNKCKAKAGIFLSEEMTHNEFKFSHDVGKPVKKFLGQFGVKESRKKIDFPGYVLQIPLKEFGRKKSSVMALAEDMTHES